MLFLFNVTLLSFFWICVDIFEFIIVYLIEEFNRLLGMKIVGDVVEGSRGINLLQTEVE